MATRAFIDGKPADLDSAVEHAAHLLARSRQPVFAGLGTDIAGARAALRLAARLRGAFDHAGSETLLRDLRVMQDSGAMSTTPAEARRRCDLLVIAGPGAGEPGWLDAIFPGFRPQTGEVLRLCSPDSRGATPPSVGTRPDDLPAIIGMIRARVKARPIAPIGGLDAAAIEGAASRLRGARFGIMAFDPADLDPLAIENLYGLVKDLNEVTRFSTLRRPGDDNVVGVNEVAVWTTGGPLRVGFGRGFPEHDAWRFDARRMVASGEADAALWISALHARPPPWNGAVPTVALVSGTDARPLGEVIIEVGTPGVDHHAVLHSPRTGALAYSSAQSRTSTPSVAEMIERIGTRLSAAAGEC